MSPSPFSALALALGAVLFLWRSRRAVRVWRSREHSGGRFPPAWIATLFAILGLLTLGLVWPATTLDRFLPLIGGQNFLNLIQALTATAGFWYLRDAIRQYSNDRRPGRRRHLVMFCLILSAIFLAIPHREGPTDTFIDDHLDSVTCWIYISLYMIGIIHISISSWRSAWTRRAAVAGQVFLAGFAFVVGGAIADLVYSAIGHAAGRPTPTGNAFFIAFGALFYPGMLTIMAGYLLPSLSRVFWRLLGWRLAVMSGAARSFTLVRQWYLEPDPLEHAYTLAIEIQGSLMDGSLELGSIDSRRFRRIERWITHAVIPAAGRIWT